MGQAYYGNRFLLMTALLMIYMKAHPKSSICVMGQTYFYFINFPIPYAEETQKKRQLQQQQHSDKVLQDSTNAVRNGEESNSSQAESSGSTNFVVINIE